MVFPIISYKSVHRGDLYRILLNSRKMSAQFGLHFLNFAEKSLEGFGIAIDDMSTNLDAELARFKIRVKEEKIANVEHREGYSGGSPHIYCLLFLCVMLFRKVTVR